MATPVVGEIIERYAREVLRAGLPLRGIVLFGSQAVGEATPDSDIDVVVVLEGVPQAEERAVLRRLWGLTAAVDHRIEPVLCSLAEWTGADCRPIIAAARTHGVELYHAPGLSLALN